MPHLPRIESQRHAVAPRRRSGPRLLCGTLFVALLTSVAFGGSAPAATNSAATRSLGAHSANRQAGPARGGKALTKEEFWRAQWRDEGAVYPGGS